MNTFEINKLNSNLIGIKSIVPDFLEIKNGTYGLGIFTKKSFKKGEIVYSTNCLVIPYDELNEEMKIRTNVGEFTISKYIHCCDDFLYGWDCFLNHNCNSNIKDLDDNVKDGQILFYSKIATRDIEEGDELLINYNHFCFDFDGIGIFNCNCGCVNCPGEIKGFKYLSKDNQMKIFEEISKEERKYFLEKLKENDI